MAMTHLLRIVLSTMLLTALPAMCYAQCATEVVNEQMDGTALFGMRWDGARLGMGQEITLDCGSRFLSVSFHLLSAESGEYNGVPYLNQGDLLTFDIVDDVGAVIATTTAPITHATGYDWVTADFSGQNIHLPAGNYGVGVFTTLDKISFISFTSTDVIDGQRHLYLEGTWSSAMSGDSVLRVLWEEEQLASEDAMWSTVKSLYR